jgi:hypothetical protein
MFTKHALKRCQQRAIPHTLCDLILNFGDYRYDKHGARIWFVTKKSLERIERELGVEDVKRLEKKKNIFLVEALDTSAVITVGYSFRPSKAVNRH